MNTITETLRRAVRSSGESLYEISKAAGFNANSLARFMRGEQSLRLDRADRLAQYLGIDFCQSERNGRAMIDLEIWRRAVADYQEKWREADAVLYKLCRRHPTHTEASAVYAKVCIIGRVYATGIERHVATHNGQGRAMDVLGRALHESATQIDTLLADLNNVAGRLTVDALRNAVEKHGAFCRVLAAITRGSNAVRTFAAKYLHFHVSAIPMLDNLAMGQARKLCRFRPGIQAFVPPNGCDVAYYRYVLRFWQLYQEAVELNLEPTARKLDYYLWFSAQA